MSSNKSSSTRTALVTGGSSGIGLACVQCLRRQGWHVSVIALPDSNLDQLSDLDVLTTPGDITFQRVQIAAVELTLAVYGRIDLLINCAGVGLYASATEVVASDLARLLEVNAVAPLALTQRIIPIMKAQGTGTIVNVASVAGQVSLPWAVAYSASKFAFDAVDDSLRRELRQEGIHVMKVCPGIVATGFRSNVLSGSAPPAVERMRSIVSADLVATRIYRGIERRSKAIYVPRIGRLFTLMDAVAPWLMDWYLSRYLLSAQPNKAESPITVENVTYAAVGKK